MEHLASTLLHLTFAVWHLAAAVVRLAVFVVIVAAHLISAFAVLTMRLVKAAASTLRSRAGRSPALQSGEKRHSF
jgi:hypothetical protein